MSSDSHLAVTLSAKLLPHDVVVWVEAAAVVNDRE